MTFGAKLRNVLAAAKQAHGKDWSADLWVKTVDEFAVVEGVMRKKKPKGSARVRNPLYDALALATGTRDLGSITRNAGKAIGVALADIMEVCPDLKVEEIERVAAAYKRRWPDPRNLSAPALAKNWHLFALNGHAAKTRAALTDVYQEPADWVPAATKLYGADVAGQMREKGWMEIGTDLRRAILEEKQRGAAA